MFAKTIVASLFAAFAAAQLHEPVGDAPQGNPITRPLLEVVEAGKPFTITWEPTTTNTVSLLLLQGPSNNVVPVETIVEGIANSGSFEYTFPSTYGGSDGPSGFGIQLIDDETGFYQYSTQFGIKVPEGYSASSSASATPSVTKDGYGTGYPTATGSSSYVMSSSKVANETSAYPTVTKHSSTVIASTGYPVSNSSVIQPSKSMTVPSSLKTSATATSGPSATESTGLPESTGAASHLSGAMGVVAGVAAMVFVL